jgi:hypothetical protein
MPLSFPSHQGLIAPLWRRWPAAFDVPALCAGAAMPDVVDGVAATWRGHFGQGIGHSYDGLSTPPPPPPMMVCQLRDKPILFLTLVFPRNSSCYDVIGLSGG